VPQKQCRFGTAWWATPEELKPWGVTHGKKRGVNVPCLGLLPSPSGSRVAGRSPHPRSGKMREGPGQG
jgi:hypothetical protein